MCRSISCTGGKLESLEDERSLGWDGGEFTIFYQYFNLLSFIVEILN